MSVRRLVIELRLEHESQRKSSNSIVKFLSYCECWSSLSGYSSHWLVITRGRIRRTSSAVLRMMRYCSFVLIEGHASTSWILEWGSLLCKTEVYACRTEVYSDPILMTWSTWTRYDYLSRKKYVGNLLAQLHRRTTCYSTYCLEWIFGLVWILGVTKIWDVSRKSDLRQTSCRLQSFIPWHDDILDLQFRSCRSWVTAMSK